MTLLLFFLITGFGSGLGTPAAYLILTDLSLIRFRGMMATLNSFSNNFAWLIGLVIGKYCPLNVVILTYAMSPALFLILSPFLPESAVWLTKKGLEKEAVKALRCVRGPDYPVQVNINFPKFHFIESLCHTAILKNLNFCANLERSKT